MENQHRKISGYRELTQEHIDLINEIKKKGAEYASLFKKVKEIIDGDYEVIDNDMIRHLEIAKPDQWLSEGIKSIQKGTMFLVRAVAQPTDGS